LITITIKISGLWKTSRSKPLYPNQRKIRSLRTRLLFSRKGQPESTPRPLMNSQKKF